jgi:Flp pilus assembly protein TadG
MWRAALRLLNSRDGAVAPIIALSLTALVAVGGLAFDYSRVASMDTELQSAADQAALAAATQLDGQDGARDRATAAARNLFSNLTYFANDGGGTAVDVPATNISFYSGYDPATGGKSPVADSDANANYVLVTVEARRAKYALTPIIAALDSGDMTASAFATLDSSYCNMPPFMVCKPNANFNATDHIGAGLRLVIGSATAPGNFGFLQTGFGTGASNLAKAIGWNGSAGGCVAARGVITEPGDKQSVRAALNTRFDMSESGQTCPAGGTCSPSTNVRKDLVKGNNCTTSGNQAWSETANPYRGRSDDQPLSTATPMDATHTYPDIMGHSRDLCHAKSQAGDCVGGIVGTGVWDRNAYFKVNYNWDNATWKSRTGLSDNPNAANYATRYKVYLWEAANPLPDGATGLIGIGKTQGPFTVPNGGGAGSTSKNSYSAPVCRPPGVPPGNLDTDRRVMAVAVVDCTGLNGRATVVPTDWINVFVVEPTFPRGNGANARTGNGDVYVEIIGTHPIPGVNQSIGNVIRRDVPRLIE